MYVLITRFVTDMTLNSVICLCLLMLDVKIIFKTVDAEQILVHNDDIYG